MYIILLIVALILKTKTNFFNSNKYDKLFSSGSRKSYFTSVLFGKGKKKKAANKKALKNKGKFEVNYDEEYDPETNLNENITNSTTISEKTIELEDKEDKVEEVNEVKEVKEDEEEENNNLLN